MIRPDRRDLLLGLSGACLSGLADARIAAPARYPTLAEARAAALAPGTLVVVDGHGAPGDGGGFAGLVEAGGSPENPGGGRIRPLGEGLAPEIWGAAGDGRADDTDALRRFAASGQGRAVALSAGRTYRLTGALDLPPGTALDLNGATLRFECRGRAHNLRPASGCRVRGGTVESMGSEHAGHGGYQCPVSVGAYLSLAPRADVLLEDLTIRSNRPNGNGIFVTSRARGVVVRNVRFPDGDALGRAVLVHWGARGRAVDGTYHPRDVLIEDIDIGVMDHASADKAGVWLSACADTVVRGVRARRIGGGGSLVHVYAGDYGFRHALDPAARARGFGRIAVADVRGMARFGVHVTMADIQEGRRVWPGAVDIEGLAWRAPDPTVYPSSGVRIHRAGSVSVRGSDIRGGRYGIMLGDGHWTDVTLEDNAISDSHGEGIYAVAPRSSGLTVRGNRISGSNGSGVEGIADIALRHVRGAVIAGNAFDSPRASGTVRIDGGADGDYPSGVRLSGNRARHAGPKGFVFGGRDWRGAVSGYAGNAAGGRPLPPLP